MHVQSGFNRKRVNMNAFTFILLFCIIYAINSLKIYRSEKRLANTKMVSGLVYKKDVEQSRFLSNNITTCLRTNVKRLSTEDSAMLLLIENSKNVRFLKLFARYPATWFKFGSPNILGWILRDPTASTYLIWKVGRWNHICFSYTKSNFYITFVKVSMNLKF